MCYKTELVRSFDKGNYKNVKKFQLTSYIF